MLWLGLRFLEKIVRVLIRQVLDQLNPFAIPAQVQEMDLVGKGFHQDYTQTGRLPGLQILIIKRQTAVLHCDHNLTRPPHQGNIKAAGLTFKGMFNNIDAGFLNHQFQSMGILIIQSQLTGNLTDQTYSPGYKIQSRQKGQSDDLLFGCVHSMHLQS